MLQHSPRTFHRLAATAGALSLLAATVPAAFAADPGAGRAVRGKVVETPLPEAPDWEVPGGDIFGFTSPTDVGSPGDKGVAFEFTGRAGKPVGSYTSWTSKTAFAYTPAENLAVAVSGWNTYHRIRGVPDLDDRSSLQFDGISGEVAYRFLERGASPWAMTASVEPRWARVDALTGERAESFSAEFKLFADVVLVPERLYAGFNLNYAPGVARPAGTGEPWAAGSGTNVSGALTYQVSEALFVGVEGRYLAGFSGAFLNDWAGHGLFVGPNLLYRLSESAALNVAWTPQVIGRADGVDRPLDLDNFERHQFRVKLSAGF